MAFDSLFRFGRSWNLPGWTWPAAIVLLAFVIRAVALWTAHDATPLLDEKLYLIRANKLLDGEDFVGSFQSWVRDPSSPYMGDLRQFPGAYQPPGYAVFVAAVLGATGRSVTAVKLAQVVLSAVTVLLVFLIGCSWFGRRCGLIAAAICALYPNLIAFSHYFWSETLYIFLLLPVILLLSGPGGVPSRRASLAAGVLLGLAALTRSATVYLLPVLFAWLVVVHRGTWRKALERSAIILAVTAAVILPWTIRNYSVHGGFVLIDTNGPFNLWRGNAPTTFAERRSLPPRLRFERPFDGLPVFPVLEQSGVGLVEMAKRDLGTETPTDLQIARYARREAWDFIRSDVPAFMGRARLKVIDMWNPTSFLVRHFRLGAYGQVNRIAEFIIIWSAVASYVAVMILGLIGLIVSRRKTQAWLAALLVVFFTSLSVVAFGLTRFRLPVMPLIIIQAAQGICFVVERRTRTASG